MYDDESDRLIADFINPDVSASARKVAAQKLYEIHSPVVLKKISRQVFNPDDVLDIAQNVWMMVLRPETLAEKYTSPEGKFGAFLDAPIRWAILKHLQKLPYTIDDAGNKKTPGFTNITETVYEENHNEFLYEYAIDEIIKPNLRNIEAGSRYVYVSSEYDLLFYNRTPSMDEVAGINGLEKARAKKLYRMAAAKCAKTRTDDEVAVYVPIEFRTLLKGIAPEKPKGQRLSEMVGISEAVFRTRLHYARKYLLELVRNNTPYSIEGPGHV